MIVRSIEGGYDKNFTYIIGDKKSRKGAIIDAAVGAEEILKNAQDLELDVRYLIITHSHHDHYAWAEALLKKLRNITLITYGTTIKGIGEKKHRSISDGDVIRIGAETLRFLHTPGHYPDSICVVGNGAIFTGDTLFIGRTGRTTSPKSDPRKLYHSVKNKILTLPDETIIYPGHNYGEVPSNNLGAEKGTNRFLQADDEEEFLRIMDEYERTRKPGD